LQRDDKSLFKGFAPVREQSGLLVAFATEPGNVAVDQSLYARALSEEMVRPGQEAGAVFRRVRLKVREDTNRQQSPEYLDKRDHDFQFAAAQSSEPQGSGAAEVVRLCREISGITSTATLAALERQHKGTPVADCISARMGELQAAEAANKQAAARADEQARADAAKRKTDEDAKARADAERQRVALLQKQEEVRKRTEAASAQPVGRGPEKTKLYAVTFAPGGKLETPPYTGGTIRRDYAGYAGTLVRDDRGIFEIKVTDVNLAGQEGLRHECTGGAAFAAIKVGAIVRMKPSNCTTLTDYFVAGAAFGTATASVMPVASAAAATASADAGVGQELPRLPRLPGDGRCAGGQLYDGIDRVR
jgi:hypothetical protein